VNRERHLPGFVFSRAGALRAILPWVLLCLAVPARSGPCFCDLCVPMAPCCISLVGSNGGVPAQSVGQFHVDYRDLANHPVAGAAITIDLSDAFDLVLCADQLDPNVVVDCLHKRVTGITDANGGVLFTILGGSKGGGNASTLLGGGKIFANGTLIGSPTVSAYDLDGSGGVGANDLSAWLGDFGSGQNFGRSDYDCTDTIGASDLSLWLGVFGSGTMTSSCGGSCP
jgi:hypothetical protein